MEHAATSHQGRQGHIPVKHRGRAVRLALIAMLLIIHEPLAYGEEFELNKWVERLVALDQTQQKSTNETRSVRWKQSHTSKEHSGVKDREQFETLLLTNFPGTYLLYLKLKEKERNDIFWHYRQMGKMESVRAAVIDLVGQDKMEDN